MGLAAISSSLHQRKFLRAETQYFNTFPDFARLNRFRPAAILGKPMQTPCLTSAQIAAFQNDGFLLVRALFDN